jgi:hypothetical protein
MANESELLETPEVEEKPSLRDTLEEAFDATPEVGAPTEAIPDKPVSTEKVAPEATPPETPVQDVSAKPQVPEGKKVPEGQQVELKAPSQWKPNVREKWNGLPREVKEEILRREGDSMRLIGSVGPKIRIADEVTGHITPFAERLSNNGVTPSAFIGEVFTSVRQLAEGDPRSKAEVVANIVQSYGVDLRLLDQILTGRIQSPPEVHQARALAARANQVLAQQSQGVQQHVAQQAEVAVDSFGADPKHEFLEDVRTLMADLIEAGRVHNLEDAYSAAVWAHPDTRKILLQREAQQRASLKNNRANAARQASSSISGAPNIPSPLGGAPAGKMSVRESLEAAFDEHSPL